MKTAPDVNLFVSILLEAQQLRAQKAEREAASIQRIEAKVRAHAQECRKQQQAGPTPR